MSGVPGPYRDRLEVLAAGGVVEAHLAAWAAQRSADTLGTWRRVRGKLRPQRSPWAVLVYEAEGGPTVQVRLLERADAGVGRSDGSPPAGDLGRIEIVACAEDPRLPGLPAVLAAFEAPRVVRYHPGSRCVVHGGTGAAARYVKVLSEAADDQQEARARWAASTAGTLSFAVAEPHGWDERTWSSWYGVVPGRPVVSMLSGREGVRLARQVGASLGELASSALRPVGRTDAASQLARTERGVARAVAVSGPVLAAGLRGVADSLARAHEGLGERPLVPVHGAAHLGQWLVDDAGRLGLVDFDRFALGEPEFDLATFVVDVRAACPGQPTDELESALLGGFRAVAGDPDAQRLALYVLHRQLAGVVRRACALRPDAEERAARTLEEVRAPLVHLGS